MSPLRGATWAAPRARRVASRRGGHRLVSVPWFAPLPLPMLDWRSGGALRGPQASPLWDVDLAQGCLGRTQRLERGEVVRGVTFCSHPGNQSSIGFAEFEIWAALDVPATPCMRWRPWASACLGLWVLLEGLVFGPASPGVRRHSVCSGLVPHSASGNLSCLSRWIRVGVRSQVSRSCKPRAP